MNKWSDDGTTCYCWLCEKPVGDTFNAIWIKGEDEATAICERCIDKANILIGHKFTGVECVG